MGEAIRRPPRRGEVTACQIHPAKSQRPPKFGELCKKSLPNAANLLWRSLSNPPIPPRDRRAFRKSGPKICLDPSCFAMKILIVF